MFNKIKNFFIRPSKYDQAIFTSVEENYRMINVLNNHLVALARITLVTPNRLFKESLNIKANTEYLESLIKAKNVKPE